MELSEISAAEAAEFQKNGVVVLRDVLSQYWLEQLADAIEANIASPGPYGKNHAEEGGAYAARHRPQEESLRVVVAHRSAAEEKHNRQ